MEQQAVAGEVKQTITRAPKQATAPVALDEVHIDDLLKTVVERGASDLHMCVGIPPVLRIDGALSPLNYEKFTSRQTQRIMYDILSDEQIQRFEEQWELDFSYSLQNMARFRVNIYQQRGTLDRSSAPRCPVGPVGGAHRDPEGYRSLHSGP